ncbi:uncharacterized protein MONBRDRAFT_37599 [Monosiga brevicollis MX1]|uniref:HSF-type DNA-binding domain-containing protein n=1 Tax=Monosiga brevicollis TaxID=81824 RepID=A9V2Q6_MONBE|nr:uncharacterized protein MONBRDRAFT_37599 [Monosiga brevicollis MX1]EDQ88413.1 predicted protein [Monosiga brevicollis MX1]|eukprot:XP_001747006.1 hypothetical protein [Monosiga brevicollis MX1]
MDDVSDVDSSSMGVDDRSPSSTRGGVPQFLQKLYRLANNDQHNHIIKWSDDGSSFWVADIAAFSRDVLPAYYKHNNYASFVRQLNMYGFHRNTSNKGKVMPGVGMIERFSNPYFRRGREDLLHLIHRKSSAASAKKSRTPNPSTPVMQQPTQEFQSRQQHLTDQRLVALERQVQFLHLQNQALAAQSARQQENLSQLMRALTRMGISTDADMPAPLTAAAPPGMWPNSHQGASFGGGAAGGATPTGAHNFGAGGGMHGSMSSGHGDHGGMGRGGFGGSGFDGGSSFGQSDVSFRGTGNMDSVFVEESGGMDIDAMLASINKTDNDGFVSVQ